MENATHIDPEESVLDKGHKIIYHMRNTRLCG